VAILHAWIWIDNPRGTWVADNWALPLVRAGLRPDSVAIEAAQALSLTAAGAVEYYTRAAAAAGADSVGRERAREAIARSAEEAKAVRASASGALDAAEVARLSGIWSSLQLRTTPGVRGH
jgi:hypothetical protein